jgi:hypothetical protein
MPQQLARHDLAERPGRIQTKADFGSALVALLETAGLTVDDIAVRSRRPAAGRGRRRGAVVLFGTTVRGWLAGKSTPQTAAALRTYLSLCGVPIDQVNAWLAARERAHAAPHGRRVTDDDPRDLGVHQWIKVDGVDPDLLPTYVPRVHDEELRAFLRGVTGARLVIVRGSSSTGKTRACYEAVRAELASWSLLYPRTPVDLLRLLEEDVPARTALWLNETQDYLRTDQADDAATDAAAPGKQKRRQSPHNHAQMQSTPPTRALQRRTRASRPPAMSRAALPVTGHLPAGPRRCGHSCSPGAVCCPAALVVVAT